MRIILATIFISLLACPQANRPETEPSLGLKTKDTTENFAPCYYENLTSELGVGLVIPVDSNSERFRIFNDPGLSELFKEVNTQTNDPLGICAKYNKHDYGILNFVCLEQSDSSFKILVNHDEIKYLPKRGSGYKFVTWSEYITTAYGISRKREYRTDFIFQNPMESDDIIKLPNERFENYCVIQVKGEWLQVKYDCFKNLPDNPHAFASCEEYIDKCDLSVGWIRWKKDNIVLIRIPHLI